MSQPSDADIQRTTRRSAAVPSSTTDAMPQLGLLLFEDARLVAAEPVASERLRVGRAADCELRVADPEVSRHHCELRQHGAFLQLTDLGSANGCFVSGRRVRQALLGHGDVLRLGQSLLKVVALDSYEWAVHRKLFRQFCGDELSGLLNRRGLRIGAAPLLARIPPGGGAGLLLLGIDQLKQINHYQGPAAGDAVIAAVAGVIGEALPDQAIAARLGDGEFAVLLREDDAARLLPLGRMLRASVQALDLLHAGSRLAVTASVGMAWQTAPLRHVGELLRFADEALHRARQNGRHRCDMALVIPAGEA